MSFYSKHEDHTNYLFLIIKKENKILIRKTIRKEEILYMFIKDQLLKLMTETTLKLSYKFIYNLQVFLI